MSRSRILVVDDQESARTVLGRFLKESGYEVASAESVAAALEILDAQPIDLVVTDLRMPGSDGLAGIRQFRTRRPGLPVIMVTAHATVETAVRAMKLGAFDYVKKPLEFEEVEIIVARALEHRRLVEENRKLRAEVSAPFRVENLVGRSAPMRRLFSLVRKVAPADVPVLVTGESGTGKDLLARAVHGLSRRASRTFLSVNCAAVAEGLLESELFGHEKGAFTGAVRARAGYFREADGGTLFLDEIGDMSLAHQAKLLRVLESGELIPVGAERAQRVDVRVIAATNRDLRAMVREKTFREDLLFRVETVQLQLPPLRERREDIPLLVAHFLERVPLGDDVKAPRLGAAAMRVLLEHPWPGNVRELAHAVEHAVLVAEGDEIRPEDLPPRLTAAEPSYRDLFAGSYREAKQAFERTWLRDTLDRAGGNVSQAAALAGIHRATFHAKLRAAGLSADETDAP